VIGLLAVLLGAASAEATAARPETVVFVCEHGSAKSVVAAAHFNRIAAERGLALRAVSRGTDPDPALAPPAVEGLHADGLVAGEATPRVLVQADLDAAVRIVAFGDLPPELAPRSEVQRWDVPPVSSGYEASRDAMIERIERLIDALQP
jgi:protein-tyrosine-phosphatase